MVAIEAKSIKLSDAETIEKFENVKRHLGLKNDAEVLRFVINWFYKKIEGGKLWVEQR